MQGRIDDLQGDTGEACTGTDIDQGMNLVLLQGGQQAERIHEMFGLDLLCRADGGEIELRIP